MAEQWTFTTEDCDEDGQVFVTIDGQMHVIASVYDVVITETDQYRTVLTAKQTGPLLAAAPELLAVCEEWLAGWSMSRNIERVVTLSHLLDRTEAAVKRAKGG